MTRGRSISTTIVVVMAFFVVAACSTQSIYRVESKDYGPVARNNLTIQEVRPAIEGAASNNGWQVREARDGSYVAWREWGGKKHSVSVDVSYSASTFSIEYKDSKLMRYSGSSIHHTYNEFITKLEAAIKTVVSGI